MQRYPSYGFFILVLIAVVILPGCGGGGDSSTAPNNTVATVTVSPASLSMEFGQVVALSGLAQNSAGETVLQTFTYKSDNTAVVTVSTSGNVCAGTWDTTFIVCTPSATPGSTTITVTAGGITKTVPVNTHRRIASVAVTSTGVACTSQTKTQQFTAKAFASDGTDITSTVGAAFWTSTNIEVATLDTAGLATAKKPGSSNIVATINNVVSVPLTMVTCPPASIVIKEKDSNPAVTSFTLDAAATKTLAADVIDTLGNPITDISLTYSSSQLSVASVTSSGVITAANAGYTGVVASCAPPTCNAGLNTPVYSNLVTVTVNGTSSTTVYATGKTAVSIIPIDTTTNVAGTAIAIPTVAVSSVATNPAINSLLFSGDGLAGFIGTDLALFGLNPTNNTLTNVGSLPGKVLAVAPNGSRVVISNSAAGLVYVFNPTATPTPTTETFAIPNATAAAFSPDGAKAYIFSGTTVYVYSPAFALRSFPVSSAVTDGTVLTQGNYAYLAGDVGSTLSARATCNDAALTSLATAQKPLLVRLHPRVCDGRHEYV